MCAAIGEMHVDMIRAASGKETGEVQGIARAQFCFGPGPVFAVVSLNEIARPFSGGLHVALEDLQNLLRRRVVNGRA